MPRASVPGLVIILAAAGIFAAWCGTPLIWDGSHQLVVTLVDQRPFVYLTRFHTWILWQPVVYLSRVTDSAQWLQFVYGLPFCLAPATGLVLSWWVVRKHNPRLILWAVFGTAAATLPGQIFIINDSIFQQHVFWPLFLGVLVPLTRTQAVVLIFLSIFQLVHPIGAALLLGGTIATAILARVHPEMRRQMLLRTVLLGLLTAAAIAKIIVFRDSYAAHEFSVWEVYWRWHRGVSGLPLRGIILIWMAGALLFAEARAWRTTANRWMPHLALSLISVASALWIYWAADECLWNSAIDYRRFVLPFTLPFFAMAFFEACTVRPSTSPARSDGFRLAAACALSALFAIVLTLQSVTWRQLTARLMRDVRGQPGIVISPEAVAWTVNTPLNHWTLNSCLMVLQGRQPRKFLLDDASARLLYATPPHLPMVPADPRAVHPRQWFDFGPLLRELAESNGPSAPATRNTR